MVGAWRVIYVVGAPALTRLAPNQTEAPFVIAQLAVLILAIVLTVVAARRFRT